MNSLILVKIKQSGSGYTKRNEMVPGWLHQKEDEDSGEQNRHINEVTIEESVRG